MLRYGWMDGRTDGPTSTAIHATFFVSTCQKSQETCDACVDRSSLTFRGGCMDRMDTSKEVVSIHVHPPAAASRHLGQIVHPRPIDRHEPEVRGM